MRLMSAPLATANSAMAAKTLSGTDSGPVPVTSSSGPDDSASRSVGTTMEARPETRR